MGIYEDEREFVRPGRASTLPVRRVATDEPPRRRYFPLRESRYSPPPPPGPRPRRTLTPTSPGVRVDSRDRDLVVRTAAAFRPRPLRRGISEATEEVEVISPRRSPERRNDRYEEESIEAEETPFSRVREAEPVRIVRRVSSLETYDRAPPVTTREIRYVRRRSNDWDQYGDRDRVERYDDRSRLNRYDDRNRVDRYEERDRVERYEEPIRVNRYTDRSRFSRSRHHRYRIHNDYHVHDHSDGSELSDIDRDDYSFTLERRKASSGGSTLVESIAAKQQPEEKPSIHTGSVGLPLGMSQETYNVLESRYAVDDILTGLHRAEVTLMDELRRSRSLYRWIHFTQRAMIFEDFQTAVGRITDLSEIEKSAITKLLAHVKEKFDKHLQTSANGKVRTMEPGFLSEELARTTGKTDRKSRSRSVTWICLPYFSLEQYSGNLSGAKAGTHPMRTLLQVQSPMIPKDRDLQQAVCHLPSNHPGHCFHVAQMWCIVLDESLLITFSRVPMATIRGSILSPLPIPKVSKAEPQRLLVSFGGSVLWSLHVNDCQTWFTLMAKFWEFWPANIVLMYGDVPVTSDLWPRILKLTKHSNEDIRLRLELRTFKKELARGVLRSSTFTSNAEHSHETDATISAKAQEQDTDSPRAEALGSTLIGTPRERSSQTEKAAGRESTENAKKDQAPSKFTVLGWLNIEDAGNRAVPVSLNMKQLDDDLREMNRYLESKTRFEDRRSYRNGSKSFRGYVRETLEVEARTLAEDDLEELRESGDTRAPKLECKVDIFNAAELVFQFFVPLAQEDGMTVKFWGALGKLFENHESRTRFDQGTHESRLLDIRDALETMLQTIQPFKELLTQTSPEDQTNIKIPDELISAWLPLLMALVFAAERSYSLSDQRMDKAQRLLDKGMEKVMHSLDQSSLLDRSMLMPMEIASLLCWRLMRDPVQMPGDIGEIYEEYTKMLETAVQADPLKRRHQDIARLQQELAVLEETANQQYFIFDEVRQASRKGEPYERDEDLIPMHRGYAKVSPTSPSGYRGLLLRECLDLSRERELEFGELSSRASELRDLNTQQIDSNRDRQESAIYAFTIVTIIFLPLGTVAGILGMNTNDVRNMEINQWVFWAVAIPLALLVIFLCLAWAGELDNFWYGFTNLWRRKGPIFSGKTEVFVEDRGRADREEEYYVTRRRRERYASPIVISRRSTFR